MSDVERALEMLTTQLETKNKELECAHTKLKALVDVEQVGSKKGWLGFDVLTKMMSIL